MSRGLSTCLIMTVVLAGCGGAGSQPMQTQPQAQVQSPSVEPTSTARAHQTVRASSRTATREAKPSGPPRQVSTFSSLLTRSTRRPPDVQEQFNYVGGAGPGPCFFAPGHAPRVTIYAQPFPAEPPRASDQATTNNIRVTFDQSVDVCFNRFGRGPVEVTMSGPKKYSLTGMLARLPRRDRHQSEWEGYDWVPAIEPTWPLGRYTISARSGPRYAAASFTLVAPTEPGLRILGPSTDPGHNEIAPHSLAKVFLVGFQNRRRVRIVIYRLSGMAGIAKYFSSTEVSLPESGNTTFNIMTGAVSGGDSAFIVTARDGDVTLYAPLSVVEPYSDPSLVVGPLPHG